MEHKIKDICSIEKIENGIYYMFNIPIQLKEIDPLPNEQLLDLIE